jgi:hypothetical protein
MDALAIYNKAKELPGSTVNFPIRLEDGNFVRLRVINPNVDIESSVLIERSTSVEKQPWYKFWKKHTVYIHDYYSVGGK